MQKRERDGEEKEAEQGFVWAKKQQQDKKAGVTEADRERIDALKKEDVQRELEKLKQRREDRDSQRQQDNSFVVHRSAQQDHENMMQDKAFALQQQKHRTPIRIKQARALPVDLLAINLFLAADSQLSQEFATLGIDCSLDDPYTLVKSMSQPQLTQTITDVQFFLNNEPSTSPDLHYWHALSQVLTHRLHQLTTPTPLNPQVLSRILEIIDNKSAGELQTLEHAVKDKLAGTQVVDVEYWEGLLGSVKARKACLVLLEIHVGVLGRRLKQLRAERETEITERVYQAEEEMEAVVAVVHEPVVRQGESMREQMFMSEASKLMEIDEEEFNTNEINLSTTIVQGYKFNIFYPDLLNPTTSPTFTLTIDPTQPDTSIITFTAGPPYEQVAFRIVGKEWEYGHKRGFKSVFDKGVLMLYFGFRRHVYKR